MNWPSSPFKFTGSTPSPPSTFPNPTQHPFSATSFNNFTNPTTIDYGSYAWNSFNTQESVTTQKVVLYYKTTACPQMNDPTGCPKVELCFNYHNMGDRRRPIFLNNKIAYSCQPCPNVAQGNLCPFGDSCRFSHSPYESAFHPAKYKTTYCEGDNCLGDICPFVHEVSEYRNPATLLIYQQEDTAGFIPYPQATTELVDLNSFKAYPCSLNTMHNHKRCIYYHSNNDRRRVPAFYSPERCPLSIKPLYCPQGDACTKTHNAVEQLYHPDKYKKRMCHDLQSGKKECEYGEYCCFAHHESELKCELLHELIKDETFYVTKFKTEWCPFNHEHNKSICVYAHNWQDYRRKLSQYRYSARMCPNWKYELYISDYTEGCPKGLDCEFSHGWKESLFHPDAYKTLPCQDLAKCRKGPDCPYFHSAEDRRFSIAPFNPTFSFGTPQPFIEEPRQSAPPTFGNTSVFNQIQRPASLQVAPLKDFEYLKNAHEEIEENEPSADNFWSPNSQTRSSNTSSVNSENFPVSIPEKLDPKTVLFSQENDPTPLTPNMNIANKKYGECKVLKDLHSGSKQIDEEDKENNLKLLKLLKAAGLEKYYGRFIEMNITIYELMKNVLEKCQEVGIENEAEIRKLKEKVESKIYNFAEPDSPGIFLIKLKMNRNK